ncbi:hypothetical protein AB0H34_16870 [Saccharopolyspora shandongensis]|uniref:hypothetical protein n=1 Tax=Saccharopolyspora shandongensis TaxID=418495 RepID=UPI0033C79B52
MDEHDWYYDNAAEPPPPGGAAVDCAYVARIYCLAWPRFTDSDWANLARIYQVLPGWQADSPDVARWFSTTEDGDAHLWASVEPSGLQVGGVLPAETWREWDIRFRQAVAAARLPRFS